MKKTEFIGITSGCKSSIVGKLVFKLFKDNGFSVAIINNRVIKINDDVVKRDIIDFSQIETVIGNKNSLDFIILDDLKTKFLHDLERKYTIDTVIDVGSIEKHKENKHIVEKKRILLNCLKRNGTGIINTDKNIVLDYFNSLKHKIIITYGLNAKSTITASSLDVNEDVSFICSIQRSITTSNGNEIEPMEFPIKVKANGAFDVDDFLSIIGVALIYEVSIDNIKGTTYRWDKNDLK